MAEWAVMERVTISVSDAFAADLARFMDEHGYDNRSEALRDLARRLTETHHGRHDLEVATLHVHLDHDHCLEVALLRGQAAEVKTFAASVIAQRGVLHGQVSYVPVRIEDHAQAHAHGEGRPHLHLRPASE